jgi:two-component system CheB/CheR fusion protein
MTMIYIQEQVDKPKRGKAAKTFTLDRSAARQIRDLEQELAHAKENVQSTVEELEASNEELQASNEELLASNEELQSSNEELQSLNEELHTVNSENQARIQDLLELTDDINNLLACSQIGTMLVDEQLRIRRMSSAVYSLTRLTTDDIGAPLEVLGRLIGPAVLDLAQKVQTSLASSEVEVSTSAGRCLLVRAAPFRVDALPTRGVTISLIDITDRLDTEAKLTASLSALDRSRQFLQATLDAIPVSIAVLEPTGVISHVNRSWETFALENKGQLATTGVGANYFQACSASEAGRGILEGLQRVAAGISNLYRAEYDCHSETAQRWFRIYAAPLQSREKGIVVCHVDISTERAQAESGS